MSKHNLHSLDHEEQLLMDEYDSVDLSKISKPTLQMQERFKEAARSYVRQEKKMNIRIDSFELDRLKQRALKEGLKYSALVKMVLHKYLTGQLVDIK